ncbi:MAG: pilus assembly protein PilM [Clostridia bacterium]|nr:pilus assembly protein PilM [Clostridia bacterium]
MKTKVAAIEFGTSKIVTVIAKSSARNNHCEIVSCGKVDYAGYSSGDWTDWDNLSKAVYNSIIAAQSDAGEKINEIYVGVPCEFIHVRTADAEVPVRSADGRVHIEDIQAVEDMAADVYKFTESDDCVIHRSPAWYSVDRGPKTMQPEGLRGENLSARISFITASADFIDDMRAIMGNVGITINGFLSPSLGEQLLCTAVKDRDDGCIFIDCGMYNTEFSVLKGDAMVYHAVLPFGGNNITADLADRLEIRYDEAELLKRSATVGEGINEMIRPPESRDKEGRRIRYKPEIICNMITVSLEELCEYLKRTLFDAKGAELTARSRIYLAGGGITLLRGGSAYLSKYLGREVAEVSVNTNKLQSPEYASVLGLVDLIFDSIEQRFGEEETLPMRVVDTFKGLLGRSKNEDEE